LDCASPLALCHPTGHAILTRCIRPSHPESIRFRLSCLHEKNGVNPKAHAVAAAVFWQTQWWQIISRPLAERACALLAGAPQRNPSQWRNRS
jgi:hypothetical protein